jgi:ABC-type multidrug transport system ATPase subunit
MPREVPTKEKDRRAEDLIELLRLKKCANTCVGSILRRGVSGGEKKRLNIANELMNNASLIMMDEPTSGLDASVSVFCISYLFSSYWDLYTL